MSAIPPEVELRDALRVMIVEDDVRFADRFRAALARSPVIQLLAIHASCAVAVEALRRQAPDILLVDLGLPDASGLEVIRECNRLHPQCDVMVITVFGDEQHVIAAIEAGATGYLLKDALPDDLISQIVALRQGGSPISPLIARQLLRRARPAAANDPGTASLLSSREQRVLELIAKGYSFVEIARLLSISPHTVMTFVKRVYRKLQVNSKTEAVYEARKMGLLSD
ncbi:MAG: response regulator transcription factor [Steroidobacteraceae bacterium]